jgi:hypothetical protein
MTPEASTFAFLLVRRRTGRGWKMRNAARGRSLKAEPCSLGLHPVKGASIERPPLVGEAAQTKAENFRAIDPQPPLALMSRETPGKVMASSVVDVSMYAIAITLGVIQ